jgi:hypothetical protein
MLLFEREGGERREGRGEKRGVGCRLDRREDGN